MKRPAIHVERLIDMTVAFGRTRNHLLFLNGNETHPKVNVWLGMTQSKVYGPLFFGEATVTRTVYIDMLENSSNLDFLQMAFLTQYGAPCHYAIIVHDYLDRLFLGRRISRGGTQPWAARSLDLTQLGFFAWGFIKSTVHTGRGTGDLTELRNRIIDAVQKITPKMLEYVFRETIYRFELFRDTDGRHVETNK